MRKLMVAVWMMVAGTCLAQQIDLRSLDKLAALASSKAEISMDESMVKSASDFLNDGNKDEALAKKAAKDLKGFYMRAYEFKDKQKGTFKLEDLRPILDQLKGPSWTSFLRAQEPGGLVEIWMHRTTNGQTDGILMVAAEDTEVVVMNAVGVANLSDLEALGQFGELAGAKIPNSAFPNPAPPNPAPKPAGQRDDD